MPNVIGLVSTGDGPTDLGAMLGLVRGLTGADQVVLPDRSRPLRAPARGRPTSAEADRAIVLATLYLLEQHGYARFSMAGDALRAGGSTATLYRRWSSKEEPVVGALATLVADRPLGQHRKTARRPPRNA
jgi:AcrR family transcriptional regulator